MEWTSAGNWLLFCFVSFVLQWRNANKKVNLNVAAYVKRAFLWRICLSFFLCDALNGIWGCIKNLMESARRGVTQVTKKLRSQTDGKGREEQKERKMSKLWNLLLLLTLPKNTRELQCGWAFCSSASHVFSKWEFALKSVQQAPFCLFMRDNAISFAPSARLSAL